MPWSEMLQSQRGNLTSLMGTLAQMKEGKKNRRSALLRDLLGIGAGIGGAALQNKWSKQAADLANQRATEQANTEWERNRQAQLDQRGYETRLGTAESMAKTRELAARLRGEKDIEQMRINAGAYSRGGGGGEDEISNMPADFVRNYFVQSFAPGRSNKNQPLLIIDKNTGSVVPNFTVVDKPIIDQFRKVILNDIKAAKFTPQQIEMAIASVFGLPEAAPGGGGGGGEGGGGPAPRVPVPLRSLVNTEGMPGKLGELAQQQPGIAGYIPRMMTKEEIGKVGPSLANTLIGKGTAKPRISENEKKLAEKEKELGRYLLAGTEPPVLLVKTIEELKRVLGRL